MSESKETRELCRSLEKLGAITLPIVGHEMQRPGWPDRWICHPLWTGWCEFKIGGGSLAPLQRKWQREVWARDPGSIVAYWHDDKLFLIHGETVPLVAGEDLGRRFLLTLHGMKLKLQQATTT